MFLSIKNHSFWWAAAELLLCLMFFVAVTAIIIYILRKPMRRHKPADLRVFEKLKFFHSPAANKWMTTITYLGKHNFLIPANLLLIFIFLVFGQQHWYAFRVLVIALSSLMLIFILKHLFRRKRPLAPLLNVAKGKSFPSGHAIMAVNFFGLLMYMLLQTEISLLLKACLSIFLILLILFIGFSRVFLQVHYASDVLAGFIIGLCWFYTTLIVLHRLELMT
ncbi:MAG: phosphatase PAP2 family protein [Ferruginibacter sp.]